MTIAQLSSWIQPNSVSIFVQPPGQAFVAFLLTNVSVPNPTRVRLDLADTEDAERHYSITRNPVERLVAQNVIREPDRLQVTGMLTAHPLLSPMQHAGLARLDKIALLQLKMIINQPLPLFIVTPEDRHANMKCVSLREHYDETTGEGVALSLAFEEILFAIPGLVEAALDMDALKFGAASSSAIGPTTPTEIVDPGGLG